MQRDDAIRLRHMLDATQEALSFARGMKREDLDDNRMLVLSLVKDIEIIGEAATKVSEDCRCEHPEIPWKDIVTMRNRLIHGYMDVNLDIVWKTVTEELPSLMINLQRAIAAP
jgi:uncharacterized protein with HEPN domain